MTDSNLSGLLGAVHQPIIKKVPNGVFWAVPVFGKNSELWFMRSMSVRCDFLGVMHRGFPQRGRFNTVLYLSFVLSLGRHKVEIVACLKY